MVYADRFYKGEEELNVSSHFTQASKDDKAGIDVNTIVIDSSNENEGVIQYVIQPGDSLGWIARKFWATISHLQKINNLGNDPIRPGQTLIITDEQEGFLYTVKEQSTVKVFADTYSLKLEDLMTLNYIQDETELLYEGQELFLNVSKEQAYQANLLERPKPRPVVASRPTIVKKSSAKTTTKKSSTNSNSTNEERTPGKGKIISKWVFNKDIKNGFYAGHCTWYAAIITPEIFPYTDDNTQKRPFGGNANQWYDNAKDAWFKVWSTPRAGALVVYKRWSRWASAGHVAKVISYDADKGEMILRDMNYAGKFIVTERYEYTNDEKFKDNLKGYIYP